MLQVAGRPFLWRGFRRRTGVNTRYSWTMSCTVMAVPDLLRERALQNRLSPALPTMMQERVEKLRCRAGPVSFNAWFGDLSQLEPFAVVLVSERPPRRRSRISPSLP